MRLKNGEFAAQQYLVEPKTRWLINGVNLAVGKISRVDGFAFGAADFNLDEVEHCLACYNQSQNVFEILPVKAAFANEALALIKERTFKMFTHKKEDKVWGISTDAEICVFSSERTLGQLVAFRYKEKPELETICLAKRFKGYVPYKEAQLDVTDFKP